MTDQPGYVLYVNDRTTAAMQLAAHFAAEAMRHSPTEDPRVRLAEQLSCFELAFRSIMGTTARTMIRTGATPPADTETPNRVDARLLVGERG